MARNPRTLGSIRSHMGGYTDQQKKQQTDSDRAHEGVEVDVDGEHDAKRARSGLLLLAKEMHLARAELTKAQTNDPEHNNANGMATIERIVHMISADALDLNSTLRMADNASTMGPEVKTVWGAWLVCKRDVEDALRWDHTNGGTGQTSANDIETTVKAMITAIGARPEDLGQTRAEPEGDAKKMSDTAFADELVAANAALDSVAAGNSADDRRLKALAQHIAVKRDYSAGFQRHRNEVVALAKRLNDNLGKNESHPNPAVQEAASLISSSLAKP